MSLRSEEVWAEGWRKSVGDRFWLPLVFVTVFVSVLDRSITYGFVDPIRRDLGLTDAQIGLLHGAYFYWGATLGNFIGGFLADRYRRSLVVLTLVVVWSVATAASGATTEYAVLACWRIVIGVAQGAAIPPLLSLVADRASRGKLPVALGLYAVGGTVAGGLVLIFDHYVTILHDSILLRHPEIWLPSSWRMALLISGTCTALAAPITYACLVGADHRQIPRKKQKISFDAFRSLIAPGAAFTTFFILGCGLLAGGQAAYRIWLPTSISRNFSAEAQAPLGLILAAAGALGCIIWTMIASKFAGKGRADAALLTMIASASVSTPFAVVAPVISIFELTLLVVGVVALCAQVTGALSHAAIQSITPPDARGRVAGLYIVANNMIASAVVWLVGQASTYSKSSGRTLSQDLSWITGVSTCTGIIFLIICVRPYMKLAVRPK